MDATRQGCRRSVAVVFVLWTVLWAGLWASVRPAEADCKPSPCLRAGQQPATTVDVMAPLFLAKEEQWQDFAKRLDQAHDMGVGAVSVDVWWGLVQARQGRFDWAYYDRIAELIRGKKLRWVPILAFHQCGGNVGDTCDIPLPEWIWGELLRQSCREPQSDICRDPRYKSEKGRLSEEYVSLWADTTVMPYYEAFMRAFADHFFKEKPELGAAIAAVDIGLGPAGELRYPSYAPADCWAYPGRGYFQAYSDAAKDSFRKEMMQKYAKLDTLNDTWFPDRPEARLGSADDIRPPSDTPLEVGRAQGFVSGRDYTGTPYGLDFTGWYNEQLLEHGARVLGLATAVFEDVLPADVPFGVKVPGIHWQMDGQAPAPRIAEITAGLVPAADVDGGAATGHGYKRLMDMLAEQAGQGRKIVLHFTCLERDNAAVDDGKEAHSLAKDLVRWVGQAAGRAGLPIMGENALPGGVHSKEGWDNIQEAFCAGDFTGLTVLRLSEVTAPGGELGHDRYARFIECFAPPRQAATP